MAAGHFLVMIECTSEKCLIFPFLLTLIKLSLFLFLKNLELICTMGFWGFGGPGIKIGVNDGINGSIGMIE